MASAGGPSAAAKRQDSYRQMVDSSIDAARQQMELESAAARSAPVPAAKAAASSSSVGPAPAAAAPAARAPPAAAASPVATGGTPAVQPVASSGGASATAASAAASAAVSRPDEASATGPIGPAGDTEAPSAAVKRRRGQQPGSPRRTEAIPQAMPPVPATLPMPVPLPAPPAAATSGGPTQEGLRPPTAAGGTTPFATALGSSPGTAAGGGAGTHTAGGQGGGSAAPGRRLGAQGPPPCPRRTAQELEMEATLRELAALGQLLEGRGEPEPEGPKASSRVPGLAPLGVTTPPVPARNTRPAPVAAPQQVPGEAAFDWAAQWRSSELRWSASRVPVLHL